MNNRWMTQDWTTGDLNALVKNLGGEEIARKIQRGEMSIKLEEVLKTLFDKNGRRIPEGLTSRVCDPNRSFYLNQPKLTEEVHYANRIMRLKSNLGIDSIGFDAEQFKRESERLLKMVRDNSQIANIANGVYLPVILVKRETDDVGAELEKQVEAVGKSYIDFFPNRKFYNYRKGELSGQVSIISDSRYEIVWERKKKGHIIALFSPNPLQGFSVHAQREQMASLPEGFILSGAIEPMIMYTDVLARDFHTPGLDLAAFSWQSSGYSLYFRADAVWLGFGRRGLLGVASVDYSSSLLFLGSVG